MRTIKQQPRRRRLESESGPGRRSLDEGGFTLVEFMIAALITTAVLGGTVALATQIQQSYGTQLDDAVVEQEARYAVDWIARDLRSAGSDPYDVITPDSLEMVINPDGAAPTTDSIRIVADITDNTPTADPSGPDGDTGDVGENVIIAFDAMTNVITRQDVNVAGSPILTMTDAIFTDLTFTYLNAAGVETAASELVTYVRVQVTAQSRARNPITQEYTTSTLTTEVRLRTR